MTILKLLAELLGIGALVYAVFCGIMQVLEKPVQEKPEECCNEPWGGFPYIFMFIALLFATGITYAYMEGNIAMKEALYRTYAKEAGE